jgi:hypothetical protein
VGGIGVLYLMDYLMNTCAFPDLTQGEAIIYKKNLPVHAKKATFVVQAKINGEMHVFLVYFVTNDNDLSAQVLKLI